MSRRDKRQEARSKKNTAVVAALVSVGVESAALLDRLTRRGAHVYPLYIRQGFRWEPTEQRWLQRLLRWWPRTRVAPLVMLDVPLRSIAPRHWALGRGQAPGRRSPDSAMYLPGRNLFLFAAAGAWCAQHGISRIAHGTLTTNPFPDASQDFFRGMSVILTRALGHTLQLEAPLRSLTKAQVVRSMDPRLLRLTFSCINPLHRRHCGRCNKCAERRRAFNEHATLRSVAT